MDSVLPRRRFERDVSKARRIRGRVVLRRKRETDGTWRAVLGESRRGEKNL